jgi:hypothetical protein
LVGFADGFGGMSFGNGDQGDFCGMWGFLSRFGDAILDAQNIFVESCWHGGA